MAAADNIDGLYWRCLAISLSCYLGLFCAFQILRVWFSPKHKFNKLTLWPYILMGGSMIPQLAKLSLNLLGMRLRLWMPTIDALRIILENLALTLQIFEWSCLSHLISFQRKYPATQVEVEKRKFTPQENTRFKLFRALLVFLLGLNYIAIVVSVLLWPHSHAEINNELLVRPDIICDECALF